MSYRIFFAFSTGLSADIAVPKGTISTTLAHVARVEGQLSLVTEKYLDNPAHWTSKSTKFSGIDDEIVCREVESHNAYVRYLYDSLGRWTASPPIGETEVLTPEIAATLWHGLELLDVPSERWTVDYYRARMDQVYESMRGRECEGVIFDAEALTTAQAASVIRLFSTFLDTFDLDLDVPRNRDSLSASDEYQWCGECGAIAAGETCAHLIEEDEDGGDDVDDDDDGVEL